MNKVALVSGASSGIGKAIASKLLEAGTRVVFACRQTEFCLENLTQDNRHNAMVVEVDVRRSSDIQFAVDLVNKHFGQLDILVNNAGMCHVSEFLKLTDDLWDEVFNVNVKSIFYFCKAVLPIMMSQGGGKIINIASQAGRQGEAFNTLYSASKFAVIGLTQSLAKEFGPYNIQTNAVCPGAVDTRMLDDAIQNFAKIVGKPASKYKTELVASIPARRFASPHDVASLVLFLAGDESSFINGACIGITGGATMF